MVNESLIIPQWPAPSHIKAYSTTRQGGISQDYYQGFNLALHVDDDPSSVLTNREHLRSIINLPSEPKWLQQVHGCEVTLANGISNSTQADASYTSTSNIVCVIMTADCLPILVTDETGSMVAAIHAGWRSLASGIIENTIKKFTAPHSSLMAWLGPAIGPEYFEVGNDVYEKFNTDMHDPTAAFVTYRQKWLANLPELASQRLAYCGVTKIYKSNECSYANPQKYFSFRRDHGKTGRMASLIWIENSQHCSL